MNLSVTPIPGEAAIVAITGLFAKIIDGQTPEQKKIFCDRYLELTAPWQALFVEASKDLAGLITDLKKQSNG